MAQMKPNQKSRNWSAEGSSCSASAEVHPCLCSPWELAPLPHLKHPTASRGLLLSQLLPGTPPHSLGSGADTSPALGVVFFILQPSLHTACWGIGICCLTRTPAPQSHCSVLCITAQGSPSAHQHCSTMPRQLDFHYWWGTQQQELSPATGKNWFTAASRPDSSFSLRSYRLCLKKKNHSLNNAEGAFQNYSKYC